MKLKKTLRDQPPYSPGKTWPNAIKRSSNENPLGTSPRAATAMTQQAQDMSIYPDAMTQKLRKKLAEKHSVLEENIFVGNGSDEVFTIICAAFMEKGDNGITASNTFSEYTFSLKLNSANVKKVDLKEGKFDLESIIELIDKRTKALFLCNPNNPTGTYFSNDELLSLLEKVDESIIVILDEAYFDYVESDDYPNSVPLIDKYPNLVITRTFSKIYGLAGARIGYSIASKELTNGLFTAKQAFNVNLVAQAGAMAALDDNRFYNKSRNLNSKGKKYLYKELDRLDIDYFKTEANFICVLFPIPGAKVFEVMAKNGLVIRDLNSFGIPKGIRYTIGFPKDNKKFIEILEDMQKDKII